MSQKADANVPGVVATACAGKVRHVTAAKASEHVRHLGRGKPYRCEFCGGWHVGTAAQVSKHYKGRS